MVFILLSGRGPQGEVLKVMKDDLFWVLLGTFGTFSLKRIAQLFLICFMIEVGREECSKLWRMIISFFSIFSRFGPFPQIFEQFKE